MRRAILVLAILAIGGYPSAEAKDGPSTVEVHKAIKRGAEWLKQRFADGFESDTWHSTPELAVLTFNHAGVSIKDKVYAAGLKLIETCELKYTYRVATLAMALSRINPYKYRARLAHCAQWLVDTQLPAGEWGYPGTVQGRAQATRAIQVKPPVTEKEAAGGSKSPPIVIQRKLDIAKFAGARGDFSNTQFALLGLRACRDARIEIPKETWQAALDYQLKYQQKDGSWGYVNSGEQDQSGYASLTAAGVVGVAISLHGLKKNHKSHPAVKKAEKWLSKKWKPSENVDVEESTFILPRSWQYYHLYSVERAGRVLRVKKFGKLDWYKEGASWLLDNQKSDGSWEDAGGDTTRATGRYLQEADTCFAILFLTLATPPLTGR